MLAEQRQRLILEQLAVEGAVAISRLTESLGVSRETIRRDLNQLAEQRQLMKTHGGAVTLARTEAPEDQRQSVNIDGKRAIGRQAARLVPDGASVIIDSGTTTRCVADALADHRRLTVFTNDLGVCLRLGRRNENRVVLLGGDLLPHDDATLGLDTIEALARYHADIAFIGAGGIAPDGDLTDFSRTGSELRTRMLRSARLAAVVADHTKLNHITPVRVPGFGRNHRLITDRAPDRALAARLSKRGIEVIVAAE